MTPYPILVIKLGALGDIILATAAFAAIRARHPNAHIVCLTSKAYAQLLAQSPYFNEIWVDTKPKPHHLRFILGPMRQMLRSQPWKWVYDLQNSTRSLTYPWLLGRPWPNISNTSRWSSHGYTDRLRHERHALENLRLQLEIAGIRNVGMPDLSWLTADISDIMSHVRTARYALLVPGGAPHRPAKRWPAEQYAALAQELVGRGITPLLIGTEAERDTLDSIAARVPQAVNLCGLTSINQLAELARGAAMAVGNDTGPMHVIAACNCPSTVLFSHNSNPVRSAPVGASVTTLRERDLRDLSVDRVLVSLTAHA